MRIADLETCNVGLLHLLTATTGVIEGRLPKAVLAYRTPARLTLGACRIRAVEELENVVEVANIVSLSLVSRFLL